MTLDDIIAEVTARLGEPTNVFTDREVGVAKVSGWMWRKDRAPYGLRIEQVGVRYTVRAWRHTLPDGRRGELLRQGPPTADEIRAVIILAGLLPGADEMHILAADPWGWTIQHPTTCLTPVESCLVHVVALTELGTEKARDSFIGCADRHEVQLNEFRDRLQILDPVDMALNAPDRSAGADWAQGGGRS